MVSCALLVEGYVPDIHAIGIGESGVGKTTFVNTLFTSTIKEPKNLAKRRSKAPSKTVQIQITRAGKCLLHWQN